ncbi:hypothetical protein [Leekyejoonella antrihumi]|uniref:Uncharacterized protein n=1 Tax=Leekyejoonella antrihumi TaxID=1660198 RepID=A0A563DUB0_9MICO|nr:hypothetical protein [Leekyejoonella antrihumi]TWP33835.1 hypothetical protein FGL98_19845 [Leekyejoonella antrihumi]
MLQRTHRTAHGDRAKAGNKQDGRSKDEASRVIRSRIVWLTRSWGTAVISWSPPEIGVISTR